MARLIRALAILLLLAGASGVSVAGPRDELASALRNTPPGACPVPGGAPTQASEKAARKGVRTFDRREPPLTLAAFSPVPPGLRGAVRRVALPKDAPKLIALTFDLCEQTGEIAGYDGAIFDYLRREKIKTTLFAGGKWMRSHEPRTRELMADPLFELGSHGWAHRNLRLLGDTARDEEIGAPQRVYEAVRADLVANQCLPATDITRIRPRIGLFRFPFGACHQASLDAVNDAGLLAIQWDVSTGDPSPLQSTRAIADAMVRNARPGSIILAHANGRGFNTAAALPLAIPRLKAKGFEFVTVGELLAAGRPEIVPTCYDSRPGDTDRYDRLVAATKSSRGMSTQSGAQATPKPKPSLRPQP